jgi:hypothetical protein
VLRDRERVRGHGVHRRPDQAQIGALAAARIAAVRERASALLGERSPAGRLAA